MKFSTLVEQVVELLQRQKRISYRALKREFDLDDEYIEDLKTELITAKQLARDEDGIVLVWTGASPVPGSTFQVPGSQPPAPSSQTLDPSRLRTPNSELISAERRQLTVMFCDLVGSTALSERLDPEELREVVRAYQETCTDVIRRYDGQIAQHLGDGLLVYFGYPLAHEDDAQRAVRAGLGIVGAMRRLPHAGHKVPSPLAGEGQGEGAKITTSALSPPHPNLPPQGGKEQSLQVRIGIHTGLVVIGEIGSSDKREILALGETPNLAARLQALAEPDTAVISGATYRLSEGFFACRGLGPATVKGLSVPVDLYQVLEESGVQSRFEVATRTGLTPLVGREQEVGLLWERWERAKEGAGQVVLLSGEAGIGKSRLVQVLKERIATEPHMRLECRCSPYHQNSALYPMIDLLQRIFQFSREDSPTEKLQKLEAALKDSLTVRQSDGLNEVVPLFAALLSLPLPERYPPLTLTPQKQKEKTQQAIITWLLKETERQSLLLVWEDLHWADPSTLELLDLLIAQAPTARIYTLLTFRPEFSPPWANRSHLTSLTLSRLPHKQVREMVNLVAMQTLRPSTSSGRTESESGGEISPVRAEPVEARIALPDDLIDAVIARTDGVPLFVEELIKMVIESIESLGSVESIGSHDRTPLPAITIPATLHDSLMARLDRLGPGKEVAQLGATLGREFSYELLQAVSALDEVTLQRELGRLVDAEFLFQRGLPPQARYVFKHALIQDAAYQSLLKSKRQQYHQQIAQVLDEQFVETKDSQPELLAHHYTEAGLREQAIPYWQRAGQRAAQRSANVEAISHLTKGLELLQTLPDALERAQQELTLQIALGAPLIATKGYGALEVGQVYARAQELCRQVGETPQLFPMLSGLRQFYLLRAELKTARKLAEQRLTLAQSLKNPAFLVEARMALGSTLFFLGEFVPVREHHEQGIALYDPQKHNPFVSGILQDPKVASLSVTALALWHLGYPDQALKRIHEALTLAQELSHPFSLNFAFSWAARVYCSRREVQAAQERAEDQIALSREQRFPHGLAVGTIQRGWALADQGQGEEGVAQIRQGLAAYRATGSELYRPYHLALLAEAYGKGGQAEEGMIILAEALDTAHKTGERWYEAELYRLKGTLTLQKFQVSSSKFQVPKSPKSEVRSPESEAEECFQKAVEIARRQQAKSLELRAVMSLSRLWQQQGKIAEARQMLAEIYGWFTEGFDTKDLQEARELIESLNH